MFSGRYVPISSSSSPRDTFDVYETTSDWHKLIYPDTSTQHPMGPQNVPPTLLPLPLPPSGGGDKDSMENYANYDEKWNVNESPTEEPDTNTPKFTKSMPGTMVLVIGIILGAFVAMILIVIIVLKMRIRMDRGFKSEDMPRQVGQTGMPMSASQPNQNHTQPLNAMAPRYQFANAATHSDYNEPPSLPDQETATTSLMEGGHQGLGASGNIPLLGGVNQNNGFFPLAMIGDRTRFFRKPNGSRAVREWYV